MTILTLSDLFPGSGAQSSQSVSRRLDSTRMFFFLLFYIENCPLIRFRLNLLFQFPHFSFTFCQNAFTFRKLWIIKHLYIVFPIVLVSCLSVFWYNPDFVTFLCLLKSISTAFSLFPSAICRRICRKPWNSPLSNEGSSLWICVCVLSRGFFHIFCADPSDNCQNPPRQNR